MISAYPESNQQLIDLDANKHISWLKNIVTTIRSIRASVNISPAKKIPLILCLGDIQDREQVSTSQDMLQKLANLDSIEWFEDTALLPASASALSGSLELHIPLKGIIDKSQEINRVEKELAKLNKELERFDKKLSNERYIQNAPAEVVEKEKEKAKQSKHALEQLSEHLARIQAL